MSTPSLASAPGKLILSGEHAVVYQQPALAMAVNRHMQASATPAKHIRIDFEDKTVELPTATLPSRLSDIHKRFNAYKNHQLPIQSVLQQPAELILLLLEHLTSFEGVHLQFETNLPIGCGMGASAALILSGLLAINHCFQLPCAADTLYNMALNIEHFQHGHSSGLDITLSQQGGLIFFEEHKQHAIPLPTTLPLYAVNTGVPSSSTGECVQAVKAFAKDHALWQAFADVTKAFKAALETDTLSDILTAIKTNHRLLISLGVVPERVQQFIQTLEQSGFAGKISGAGSITGNAAGIVLVYAEDDAQLAALCNPYAFSYYRITGESQGARIL